MIWHYLLTTYVYLNANKNKKIVDTDVEIESHTQSPIRKS